MVKAISTSNAALQSDIDRAGTSATGSRIGEFVDRHIPILFNIPTAIFLFGLVFVPIVLVILMSFTDWQLITKPDPDFVGLDNYIKPWSDERWIGAMLHTLIYAVVSVAGQFAIGLGTALLFNRSFAGKAFYRSVWMMPMISMSVAISLVWILFFDSAYGMLNFLLSYVGIEPIEWTTSPQWALASLIVVGIWHYTPFMTLILLAGLQSLPQDPFEAARIDGASRWQTLWHITLPLLKAHIMVALILRSIFAIKEFDTFLAITEGGPAYASETMNLNIYFNAFEYQYMGEAAAKGVIFFAFIASIQLVLVRLRKRSWSY
jgi:multiple sugar transport system permease protein